MSLTKEVRNSKSNEPDVIAVLWRTTCNKSNQGSRTYSARLIHDQTKHIDLVYIKDVIRDRIKNQYLFDKKSIQIKHAYYKHPFLVSRFK